MEYTVGSNWDFDLIEKIDYPEVKSVFGGVPNTIISGGRSSMLINSIQDEEIKKYIEEVHKKGWQFDYNVNSSCIENMELTQQGHKEILKYFEWIESLGVDSVTIAIPNLIKILKKHFPKLKVKVSTFQKVNSVSMAKYFEDMGADAIMLSEHVNRDFKLLRAVREAVECKIVLMANTGCIYGCPNMHTHANSIAHSGMKTSGKTVFTESYAVDCQYKRLKSIEELIKIRWIRPEDVGYYEEIGIDMLKIIDRHSTTEAIAERMKAYHERSYDGNFLNLLGQMINKKKSNAFNIDDVDDFESKEKLSKMRKFLSLFNDCVADVYYLDNKKIDNNFIKHFEKVDCNNMSCEKCGYCKKVAQEAIITKVDEEKIQKIISKHEDILDQIIDGNILY